MSDEKKPPRTKLGQFLPGDKNPRRYARDRSGIQPGGHRRCTSVRQALLDAFDTVGGVEYLVKIATSRKDRHAFINLLAKAIPQEIVGKDGGPIEAQLLVLARVGVANLSDERLDQLRKIYNEMGVGEVLTQTGAANDTPAALPAAVVVPEAAKA